jgi:hypothetical protein
LLILKNFQRSKKVTNIYRFTSGLLSTTDPFQIQASTGDSKETCLKHRLFSLPGSSVCHVCVRGNASCIWGPKNTPDVEKWNPLFGMAFGTFWGPKKPFVFRWVSFNNVIFLVNG